MYDALYDEKHRFWCVSVHQDERNELKQKGERENLLCDECEGRFARHEQYASLVHKGGVQLTAERWGRLLVLSGIDYQPYKLFLLSVLWRASASRRDFFERVNLGPHQEQLRLQLLTGDPGKSTQYGCVMFGLTMMPGETPGLIMQPARVRVDGFKTYKFVFGGIMWLYYVDTRELGYPYTHTMLSEEGKLAMQIRGIEEMRDLRKFATTAAQRGKFREA